MNQFIRPIHNARLKHNTPLTKVFNILCQNKGTLKVSMIDIIRKNYYVFILKNKKNCPQVIFQPTNIYIIKPNTFNQFILKTCKVWLSSMFDNSLKKRIWYQNGSNTQVKENFCMVTRFDHYYQIKKSK
jgi:hypothetical protein